MNDKITDNKNKIKNPSIIYFILAIGITWLLWIPTLIISTFNEYFVPSVFSIQLIFEEGFKNLTHLLVFSINQLGVYGPFIAAVITLLIFNRNEDLKFLFKSMVKWNVKLKWYGFILLIPVIINFGSLGLAALFGADMSLAFNPGMGISMILMAFFINLITSGLEEPGWRGFAVPEVNKKYSAYKSSIIVGIIWAIWHYPYVFYLNFVELNSGMFLTILAMAGFTAIMTFGSILYTWIYVNTESVFLLIIFHTLQNMIPILIIGGVIDPLGGFSTALFTIILAFLITRKYGEKTLKGLTEKELMEREKKDSE
jgi:hypothetical protein